MEPANMHNKYPTISTMTDAEMSQFTVIKEFWMQDRSLAKEQETACSAVAGVLGFSYSYEQALDHAGKLFMREVSRLNSTDILLDTGAGAGKALMVYRRLYPDGAQVIGIAAHRVSESKEAELINSDKKDEKFSFYLCDTLKFPTETLKGRVSLICDIQGAFRYGLNPAAYIRKIGELLMTGGYAFITMGYNDRISASNIPSEFNRLGSREKKIGSKMLMLLWFQTIKGFTVIPPREDCCWELAMPDEVADINKKIRECPDKIQNLSYSDSVMVLQRNSDNVEVDELVPEMTSSVQDGTSKDPDDIRPNYTWIACSESKKLIDKLKWVNT